MYAITSMPFDSLTLAIFLCAEFGFFGVVTVTFRQTHLLNGQGIPIFLLFFIVFIEYCIAGAFDFFWFGVLFVFSSWLNVGIVKVFSKKKRGALLPLEKGIFKPDAHIDTVMYKNCKRKIQKSTWSLFLYKYIVRGRQTLYLFILLILAMK